MDCTLFTIRARANVAAAQCANAGGQGTAHRCRSERWGQGKGEGVLYRIKTFNAIKYIKQGKTSMGENTMILNNS